MTIRFALPITPQKPRERFVVEFERDGSISFPDYNLEYDQTIAALSGEETTALKIYGLWNQETAVARAAVIRNYLGLKDKTIWRFSVDCAAHVIDIYEEEFKNDTILREVVDFTIKAIPHKGFSRFLRKAFIVAETAIDRLNHIKFKLGPAAEKELVAAYMAANAVKHITHGERLDEVMNYAHGSRGYEASPVYVGYEWNAASKRELAWEIRRFHDVILAKQQGKKWPPMGATP